MFLDNECFFVSPVQIESKSESETEIKTIKHDVNNK